MSFWEELIQKRILRKDHIPTDRYKDHRITTHSIYPQKNMTMGDYCKKFNWVNFVFKHRFITPILLIGEKLLGKHLENEIEQEWYNKNLIIFNESWKESQVVLEKAFGSHPRSWHLYNLFLKFWMTLSLNDNVTREFTNIFAHTLATKMQKEYKGKKEVYHVIYENSKSYDPIYFNIGKEMMIRNIRVKGLNVKEK